MFQTEFEFTLPKGYLDGEGNLHRKGMMRLAKAADEIDPLKDPRVQANPAYATVVILARVITKLGAVEKMGPKIIENLYATDLNYLYDFYQRINAVDPTTTDLPAAQPTAAEPDPDMSSPSSPAASTP